MIRMGETLRRLRVGAELTQREFGKMLGVSESVISLYEGNKRNPNYEVLMKISEFFGVSTDYIIGNERFVVGPVVLEKSEKLMQSLTGPEANTIDLRKNIAAVVLNRAMLKDECLPELTKTVISMTQQ